MIYELILLTLRIASFSAAVNIVVRPDAFQSNASTVPNDWNQTGSAILRTNSSGPNSATRILLISRPNLTIFENNHMGHVP